jgi:hypothetical protein
LFALFAAPVDGSAPAHELRSGVGSAGPGVNFVLSADGERVLFLSGGDQQELYSARLLGAPGQVRLNPPLERRSSVAPDFQLAPDGQSAYYRARLDGRSRPEVYRVPVAGGPSARLTPDFAGTGSERSFALAPGGERLLYLADQDTPGQVELYSVAVDGSALAVRLNGARVAGGDVLDFHPVPDGSALVYRADQELDGLAELFAVPLVGRAEPVRLAECPWGARRSPGRPCATRATAATPCSRPPMAPGSTSAPCVSTARPRRASSLATCPLPLPTTAPARPREPGRPVPRGSRAGAAVRALPPRPRGCRARGAPQPAARPGARHRGGGRLPRDPDGRWALFQTEFEEGFLGVQSAAALRRGARGRAHG